MKVILTRGLALSWLLLAILIVGLAVVISTARITLPLISDYRTNIEEQVSEIMQRPVQIGSIGVGWDRLRPVMLLSDVIIRSKGDERDAFHFEQLQLSFQMFRSVREMQLIPHSVYLSGSELAVTRTMDGGFVLRGLSGLRPTGNVTVGERLENLRNLSLSLRDIRLIWHDQPFQQNWEFNTDELRVIFWPGGLSLQGTLDLPPELGETVDVTTVIRGNLTDYRQWEGAFYLRSDDIDVSALPTLLTRDWPTIAGGSVSTETWGSWQGLESLDLQGRMHLKDFMLLADDGDVDADHVLHLKHWSGDYHWASQGRNWHLDMNDMVMETQSQSWPVEGLSLDFSRRANQPGRLRGDLDFIALQDVGHVGANLPIVPEVFRRQLAGLKPSGELKDIRFDVETHTRTPRYQVEAELSQLSWLSHGKLPGVSGLDFSVSLNDQGGQGHISGPGFSFDYPRWFENTIDLDSVDGEISWQREGNGWGVYVDNLTLSNPDARGFGTVQLTLSPDLPKPLMALEILVPELDVARVPHYLPYGIIPDKSEPWLRHAFISGVGRNGIVRFDGELKKNAIRYEDVLFTADVDAHDTQLHYRDNWPDATDVNGHVGFVNAGFSASVASADIGGVDITGATVGIADLFLSRLKLEANATGKIPQYFDFLRDSGIAREGLSKFLSSVDAQGTAGLKLGLDIPLTRKIEDPMTVDGRVSLDGNTLALPEHEIEFSNVQGALQFDLHNFWADGLKAIFREAPVTSSIHTRQNRDVVVDVEGVYTLQQLLPELEASWMDLAPGESQWRGRVIVPRNGQETAPRLEVSSALQGIAIRLPGALGKTVEQSRDFTLGWELGTSLPTVDINYDERVKIRSLVNTEGGRFVIDRADVVTGGGAARVGEEGIAIRGQLDYLDLQQWAAVIEELSRNPGEETLDLREINLQLDTLAAFDQTFNDVSLRAFNESGDWEVLLNAQDIVGTIKWPKNWQSGARVEADLERLVVSRKPEDGSADNSASAGPEAMPSIHARIRNLAWGQAAFNSAEFDAVRSDEDWLIQTATFDSDILSVRLAGAWLGNGDKPATTRLQFKLDGSNVGSALQALEFSTGFGDGQGIIQGDVSWTGSPFHPDFETINGHAIVDLRDGALKEVDPGLGRLLGLANFDNLPKRLALNFKDVAMEGLHYDTISGTGRFENGVLHVDGLGLDSPGAAISIYGRTFLGTRRYDLNLNVVPKVKSALPLAAGVFVAPQTGFLVYFLDKLAEALGVDFNESALLSYHISGDWDSPTVERTTATVEEVRENPLDQE